MIGSFLPHFSNRWKKRRQKFQSLEKIRPLFPTIGNFPQCWKNNRVQGTLPVMELLVLSPHLDDAVLSLGGTLFETDSALVVNIFTCEEPREPVSPFVTRFHDMIGLSKNVQAARRAEEEAACRVLGVTPHYLDVEMEAIYRTDSDGVALYDAQEKVMGPIHENDQALIEKCAAQFATLPEATKVFAPLEIGGHVDHQIVRHAAEAVFSPAKLCYYEDYPYAQQRFSHCQYRRVFRRLKSVVMPISEAGATAKVEAIDQYASQLAMLFGRANTMSEQVHNYLRKRGGERCWTVR